MDRATWIGLTVALAIAGGGVWYYKALHRTPPPQTATVLGVEPATPAPAEPAAEAPPEQFPVPQPAADAPPLPPLAQSDGPVARALTSVFGQRLEPLLIPKSLVRNIVATVDSLDRGAVALRLRPLAYVTGQPGLETEAGVLVLSPRNYERYAPLIALLQAADAQRIAELYLRHYPLFQRAYEELGYPGRSFNDRLVAVIDHLLQAPEPTSPVALVRPKVLYEYDDPELEERSSGQKILVRIGPRNAVLVKEKLRAIRAALAASGAR
ncbi:MAG TPA: DUF3014 domain-containing protein [Candidatus Binatia bacterium]|nr:DUF3014 domain-containing protein [Candidatus Binatia bacterium]